MESNIEQIKRKIRALINLGEDGGATEAEAENALRFARRLMLQHNVAPEDMERARDGHESAADAERTTYTREDFYTQTTGITGWETSLGLAINLLVGTTKWYINPGVVTRRTLSGTIDYYPADGVARKSKLITFFGPEEDVRDAKVLMYEWTMTLVALARMKFGGAIRGEGRSYCEGFADALLRKMRAIREEERLLIEQHKANLQLSGRSTALVVMNGSQLMEAKQQRALTWLKETIGIKLSKGGGSRGGANHGGAYAAGKADGQRADFSHSRTKKIGGGA